MSIVQFIGAWGAGIAVSRAWTYSLPRLMPEVVPHYCQEKPGTRQTQDLVHPAIGFQRERRCRYHAWHDWDCTLPTPPFALPSLTSPHAARLLPGEYVLFADEIIAQHSYR